MTVIELFAGIGATRMALKNIGVEHKVIGVSEIDTIINNMYNSIHGITKNFGDITKIKSLPYCDFLHCSSPCISFSQAGKKDGLKGESGLILEFYRLMDDYYNRQELPKYVSFENVPEMVTKFPEVFNDFLSRFKDWGYNTYYSIINASYYGCVSKRERLFIVAIKKDIDDSNFIMPTNDDGEYVTKRFGDYLKDKVDPLYDWPRTPIFHPLKDDESRIDTTRKLGWLETECGHQSQSNRVWSRGGMCPTITTRMQVLVKKNDGGYRKVTEEEYWRIMQFSEEDYNKIKDGFSRSAIIKAVGNSIALGPLEAIYSRLFKKEGK